MAASDTRERLLAATIDLLGGPGLTAVSARSVANAAGVNQALVFYHFSTVAALVREATRVSTQRGVDHYRPGIAAAALAHAQYAEIIPDLQHIHPGVIRLAARAIRVPISSSRCFASSLMRAL